MNRICGNCRDFSIKDCPDQAEKGIGKCAVQWEPGISPYMPWDGQFCVLWGRATANPARDRWLRAQRDKASSLDQPTKE
jgi:hypothetical protein